MPLLIAVPDDYTGATDDIKVRAAIADTSQAEIAFQRMYTLADPTAIALRASLTLTGPGKHCGCGITRTTGAGHLFRADGTSVDMSGITIRGLDFYGANATGTVDRVLYATNLKQSKIENCLTWAWTGTAFYVDGVASNTNASRENRFVGGSHASSTECGIYHYQGNMASSDGDYISGYATLIRGTATRVVVNRPILESATGGGDGVYIDGGDCSVIDGWFDPSTMGRTIVQVGSHPVFPKRNRGVYSTNVHVSDSSKWFAEYNPV